MWSHRRDQNVKMRSTPKRDSGQPACAGLAGPTTARRASPQRVSQANRRQRARSPQAWARGAKVARDCLPRCLCQIGAETHHGHDVSAVREVSPAVYQADCGPPGGRSARGICRRESGFALAARRNGSWFSIQRRPDRCSGHDQGGTGARARVCLPMYGSPESNWNVSFGEGKPVIMSLTCSSVTPVNLWAPTATISGTPWASASSLWVRTLSSARCMSRVH